MHLTARFVRMFGAPDRVFVQRSDGTEASWSLPNYGDDLPHDLVHLVTESAFGIDQGFWQRVDQGADAEAINAETNRMGGPDRYAAAGDDLRELMVAEIVTNLYWAVPAFTDKERLEFARETASKAGLVLPDSVTLEQIARVRTTLHDLRAMWRQLEAKGTIELRYPA